MRRSGEAYLSTKVEQTVVVHTKDDKTYQGALWYNARDGVVLKGTKLIQHGMAPLDLPGETYLPRENISIVQAP